MTTGAPAIPAETQQLDFWLGSWECRWEGGAGHNTVRRILDGRVVLEEFEAPDLRGRSVSLYDTQLQCWRQTWVDNQGSYFDLTGHFAAGQMVLTTAMQREERSVHLRMVFCTITPAGFEWRWESSADGGTTWELRWRIDYVRIAPASEAVPEPPIGA